MAAATHPVSSLRRRTVTIASVVPGLGQLLNGQPAKAARLFLGTVASLGVALWGFVEAVGGKDWLTTTFGPLVVLIMLVAVVLFLGLFVYGLYLWGSAFIDAHASATALGREGEAPSRIQFFHL